MKIKFFIILLISICTLSAQFKLDSFDTEGNTEAEPVSNIRSNTIIDIFAKGDTILLATNKGMSYSFNGGNTWYNTYGSAEFGTESVSSVDYHNGVMYASTSHSVERDGSTLPEGSGLRISSDFGATWKVVPQSVDSEGDSVISYGVNNIRALPVTVAINNITYDMAVTDDAIFITSFAGGLRKSTDMGDSWERIVLPPDNLSYIHPDSTYSFSLQPVAGKFGNESYLNHRVFSITSANNDTLYVGTAGGINKTTDGGESWLKFNHVNQTNSISGNFIVAIDYNNLDSSVWASTWKAEGATEFYGISSSSDGGRNWINHLPGFRVHDFAFLNNSFQNRVKVLVAADEGLFLSSDDQLDWISPANVYDPEKNLQLLDSEYYTVEVPEDNSNIIWAGAAGEGLAKFTRTGDNWTGSWQSFFVSKAVNNKDEAYAFPNPFSPDDENVRIKYIVPSPGAKVTIRILDFGMNLVRTVIRNVSKNSTGEQIDYWDGRDENGNIVANGVYFFRVDTDDDEPQYGKIIVLM